MIESLELGDHIFNDCFRVLWVHIQVIFVNVDDNQEALQYVRIIWLRSIIMTEEDELIVVGTTLLEM